MQSWLAGQWMSWIDGLFPAAVGANRALVESQIESRIGSRPRPARESLGIDQFATLFRHVSVTPQRLIGLSTPQKR
jgi:hypothetical protein